MADAGHEATEKIIAEMEKKLSAEYAQAEKEVKAKLDDYFRRFEAKDAKWQEWVKNGVKTDKQYKQWRTQQIAQGERWTALKEQLAEDFQNANKTARSTIDGYLPEVYAINHNYGIYQIENGGEFATSLTLYDRQTVERLMRDDPELLPPPGKTVSKAIAQGRAERWSRQKLQSVMAQGILQGESIPKLATRLAKEVGESNRKAAIRNARTMATSAQNAGRYDSYRRARDKGIDLTIEWQATLDQRTRHDHRMLHGQRREVDEPFEVDGIKILYPAQLKGASSDIPQHMIWNCRCTLLAWVKGFEGETIRKTEKMNGMSFEEWLEARPVYNPIDLPEKKAAAIKASYIKQYGGRGGDKNVAVKSIEEVKPFVSKYTPGKTIEDVNQAVSRIVDSNTFGAIGVSFNGVDVGVANRVAKTITDLYDEFNVPKFGGIVSPAGNTKLGQKINGATAAYSPIRNSFLLNRQSLKTEKIAEKAFANERNAIQDILTHPEKYDMERASARLKRVVENSRLSGRGTVPDSIEEALTHEFGHALEKQISKMESFTMVKENMMQYAPKISGYAQEDISEYIAESFTAWRKGGIEIDPVLESCFKRLRRE